VVLKNILIVGVGFALVIICTFGFFNATQMITAHMQEQTQTEINVSQEKALSYYERKLAHLENTPTAVTKSLGAEAMSTNSVTIPEPNEPIVYDIETGDTLTAISAQHGYSVDELANYNQIRDVNLIYNHSVLRIPSN